MLPKTLKPAKTKRSKKKPSRPIFPCVLKELNKSANSNVCVHRSICFNLHICAHTHLFTVQLFTYAIQASQKLIKITRGTSLSILIPWILSGSGSTTGIIFIHLSPPGVVSNVLQQISFLLIGAHARAGCFEEALDYFCPFEKMSSQPRPRCREEVFIITE